MSLMPVLFTVTIMWFRTSRWDIHRSPSISEITINAGHLYICAWKAAGG